MPFGPEENWHSELDAAPFVPPKPVAAPAGAPPSMLDTWAASYRQNNLLSMAIDHLSNTEGTGPDVPGFDPRQNIPAGYEDRAEKFASATSPKAVSLIKQQLDSDKLDQDTIRRSGGMGFAASLAAGITDPITLASFALPMAGETRAGTIAINALGGAATQTAEEAAKAALGHGGGFNQSAWDVGATTFLSGVIGTIIPKMPKGEFNSLLKGTEHDLRTIPEGASELTGHSGIAGPVDDAVARQVHDETANYVAQQIREGVAARRAKIEAQAMGPEAEAVAATDHGPIDAANVAAKKELDRLSRVQLADKDQQIAQEIERLKSGPGILDAMRSRYSGLSAEYAAKLASSKVVDEAGNPAAAYHGTTKQFDEFRNGFAPGWGEGVYFTDNEKQALEEFAGGGKEGRVIKAYLDIKNPWDGSKSAAILDPEESKAFQRVKDKYPDWVDAWQEDSKFVGDLLRERGYDGVITHGSNNIAGKEIVAFHPSQIKQVRAEDVEKAVNEAVSKRAGKTVEALRSDVEKRAEEARQTIADTQAALDRRARVQGAQVDLEAHDYAVSQAKHVGELADLLPEAQANALKKQLGLAEGEKFPTLEIPKEQAPAPVTPPDVTIYAEPEHQSGGAAASVETTLEQEGADTAVGRWLTKNFVGRWSPGNRILSSPFKSARQALQKLANVNTTIGKNAEGIASASPVERDLWHHIDAGTVSDIKRQDAAYSEYRQRLTEQGDSQILSRREFNEETGKAMRNGDAHPTIPEISKVAKTHRVELDKAWARLKGGVEKERKYLQSMAERDKDGIFNVQNDLDNLDKFEQELKNVTESGDPEKARKFAASYMMRQYDHVKIANDQAGFFKLIKEHFMNTDEIRGMSALDRADLEPAVDTAVHKTIMNVLGTERGLMDWKILEGAAPESGRLKGIKLAIPDRVLEPYLVNDINSLMHSYRKSVYPQALITEQFGDRHMAGQMLDIQDEYFMHRQTMLAKANDAQKAGDAKTVAALNGKGGEIALLDRQYRESLRDLRAIRDRAYGIYGQAKDPAAAYIKWAAGLRYVNAASKLGSATLSHFGDLNGVMMRYGIAPTMGAIGKMAASSELRKMSMQQAQRFGAALDMFMNSHNIMNTTSALLQGYDHAGSQGAVLDTMANISRGVTTVSGETPLITMVQSLASVMGGDEIARTAGKLASGGKVADSVLRRLAAGGIDESTLRSIGKFDALHGQDVGGLRMMNSHLWQGPEGERAAQAVQSAILREAHSVTLRPGMADTPLMMSTWWGKTLFQFQSFAFAAQNAVLTPMLQGLSRGDPRMMSAIVGAGAMGFLSYTAHRIAAGKEPEYDHPMRMAMEVADKSNLTGAFGRWLFPLAGQLGLTGISRYFDQKTDTMLGLAGGPTLQGTGDIFGRQMIGRLTPQPIIHALDPSAKPIQFRRSDLHALRKMAPANNLWWARAGIDHVEDSLGDAFNLPGRSLKSQNTLIQQD